MWVGGRCSRGRLAGQAAAGPPGPLGAGDAQGTEREHGARARPCCTASSLGRTHPRHMGRVFLRYGGSGSTGSLPWCQAERWEVGKPFWQSLLALALGRKAFQARMSVFSLPVRSCAWLGRGAGQVCGPTPCRTCRLHLPPDTWRRRPRLPPLPSQGSRPLQRLADGIAKPMRPKRGRAREGESGGRSANTPRPTLSGASQATCKCLRAPRNIIGPRHKFRTVLHSGSFQGLPEVPLSVQTNWRPGPQTAVYSHAMNPLAPPKHLLPALAVLLLLAPLSGAGELAC